MPKLYRSREGDVTALETKTQLTTLGSETAPGPLLVPAGVSKLVAVITTFGSSHAAVGDSGALVRLEGPGLPEGPEVLVVGAVGVDVATGKMSATGAERIEMDVDVTPTNEILIFGEMTGEDGGSFNFGVTLEFE